MNVNIFKPSIIGHYYFIASSVLNFNICVDIKIHVQYVHSAYLYIRTYVHTYIGMYVRTCRIRYQTYICTYVPKYVCRMYYILYIMYVSTVHLA